MIASNAKITKTVNFNVKNPIISFDSFKNFPSDTYHLNRATFNHLLNRTFDSLQNPNSQHYLIDNQWLLLAFKKIFLKNPLLLKPVYKIVNDFYKIYPFNLESIFISLVNDFFKKYPFKKTVTNNSHNLVIISEKGINFFAQKIFKQFFITYINENLQISKLKTKYKSFKSLFRVILREQITKFLSIKINNFNWSDYKHLDQWINNFDYQSAHIVNINNIYDQFFAHTNNLQKINLTEDDFIINYLTPYLFENLNSPKRVSVNTQIPMLAQVFLYYLFIDFLTNKQIKPVNVGALHYAKSIHNLWEKKQTNTLDSISDNYYLFNAVMNFFDNLWYFFREFNFKFKTDKIKEQKSLWFNNYFGISIDKVTLLPVSGSTTTFNLQIQLKFITSAAIFLGNKVNHIFTIKLIETKSDFEKAKQIVRSFFKKNSVTIKKPYFLNSSSITEKDLKKKLPKIKKKWKKWLLHHRNHSKTDNLSSTSLKNDQQKKQVPHFFGYWVDKSDINNYWNKFFTTDLSTLNQQLSKIKNPHYNFKLKLIIGFLGYHNYQKEVFDFFSVWIDFYILLVQEPKNKDFKERHILNIYRNLNNAYNYMPVVWKIKNQFQKILHFQKLLLMIDVIKELFKKKFPQGLTFNSSKDQKNFFWLEEFLDKNNKIIKFNDLKTKNDLLKRSNLLAIKTYLNLIISKINQYRNDIVVKENYSVYKNKQTGQQMLKLDFIIKDKYTNQEFVLSTAIKLMSLKNYKNNTFFDFFEFSKPLSQLSDQQKLRKTEIQPSFTFLYKNQKISLADLKARFKKYGVTRFYWSKVYRVIFKNDVLYKILVMIDFPYHSLATGKTKYKHMVFDLYLETYNLPVSPSRIEYKYKESIGNIQENNHLLVKEINNFFDKLKDSKNSKKWRNDVKKDEFFKIISQIEDLISHFNNKNVIEIIGKLRKVYGDKIPPKILDMVLNAAYYEVLKEILNQREKMGNKNIKKILENDQFVNFLRKQKISRVRSLIIDFLKTSEKTKYAYFGVGVGFGAVGLLSAGSGWWWNRVRKKSQTVNVKFKRSKYLIIMTTSSSLLAITTSVIFMILFFITKGGF